LTVKQVRSSWDLVIDFMVGRCDVSPTMFLFFIQTQ
jgi:hypothetical protein